MELLGDTLKGAENLLQIARAWEGDEDEGRQRNDAVGEETLFSKEIPPNTEGGPDESITP
jgi:hypothetical protein